MMQPDEEGEGYEEWRRAQWTMVKVKGLWVLWERVMVTSPKRRNLIKIRTRIWNNSISLNKNKTNQNQLIKDIFWLSWFRKPQTAVIHLKSLWKLIGCDRAEGMPIESWKIPLEGNWVWIITEVQIPSTCKPHHKLTSSLTLVFTKVTQACFFVPCFTSVLSVAPQKRTCERQSLNLEVRKSLPLSSPPHKNREGTTWTKISIKRVWVWGEKSPYTTGGDVNLPVSFN